MNSWLEALLLLAASTSSMPLAAAYISPSLVISTTHRTTSSSSLRQFMPSSLSYKTLPDYLELDQSLAIHAPEALPHLSANNKKHPRLEDVDIFFLPTEDYNKQENAPLQSFPLVIASKKSKSLEFLSSFLRHNRQWLQNQLLQHGAILFRGFDIQTAQDVEDVLKSYDNKLSETYRGTSPRHPQGNTQYVFSAAEVPSHYPIAQHTEMSFLPEPPKTLYFSALQAPQSKGGETALADFRKVYQDIPARLQQKLHTKKLRYTRTHKRIGERFTHDVAAMLSWSELFRTSDKHQVEAMTAQENMPMHWEGRNQDTFVSEFTTEAFQLHPQTKEPVWYNHAQVFHWTSFPAELLAAFRRTRDVRYLIRAILIGTFSFLKYGLLRQKMALNVAYGDGTPLSIWEMHQIRKAVHSNTVYNRWQQGDLVMIDNFSTSHGRQPTYDKGRNIVVAWSEPLKKANEMAGMNLKE